MYRTDMAITPIAKLYGLPRIEDARNDEEIPHRVRYDRADCHAVPDTASPNSNGEIPHRVRYDGENETASLRENAKHLRGNLKENKKREQNNSQDILENKTEEKLTISKTWYDELLLSEAKLDILKIEYAQLQSQYNKTLSAFNELAEIINKITNNGGNDGK